VNVTGELLNQLKQLDQDITRSLLDVSRKLGGPNGSKELSPFVQFKKLLLSSGGQNELDTLVSGIQGGTEPVHCECFNIITESSHSDAETGKRTESSCVQFERHRTQ